MHPKETFVLRLFVSSLLGTLMFGGATSGGAEPPPPVKEVRGTDLGGAAMILYAARDRAAWDEVKKAAGDRRMLPIGMPKGEGLDQLDATDFQREMIVAVFWGQMSFAGEGEKCWIESVTAGHEEVTVHCRANLWGGAVDHAYRAWPYHAKAVPRSGLPVTFVQTTDFKANPKLSERAKKLATLQPGERHGTMPKGK
jgi:hypothetical protein